MNKSSQVKLIYVKSEMNRKRNPDSEKYWIVVTHTQLHTHTDTITKALTDVFTQVNRTRTSVFLHHQFLPIWLNWLFHSYNRFILYFHFIIYCFNHFSLRFSFSLIELNEPFKNDYLHKMKCREYKKKHTHISTNENCYNGGDWWM